MAESEKTVVFHDTEFPVTNAACCNEGRVRCRKCAAQALEAAFGDILTNIVNTANNEASEEGTAVSQEMTLNVPVDEEPLTPALFFGAVGGPVSPSQQQQPAAPSTPTEALNAMYATDMHQRMARNARGASTQKRQPVEQPVTNEGEESPLLPVTAAQHGY